MEEKVQSENTLELLSTIGFAGSVRGGLINHPNQKHIIYAIGSTIVIRDTSKERTQHFLHGHSNTITCIAVSPDGRYIASGQLTQVGFKAQILVWDFESRKRMFSYSVHNVRVKGLAFSPRSLYLVSLGGEEDGTVAVFSMHTGKPVSGAPASRGSAGHTHCVAFSNTRDECFITGGEYTLRVWEVDPSTKKLTAVECQFGTLKRIITTLAVDDNDDCVWGGTTTGDIVQVAISTKLLRGFGPNGKNGAVLNKGVFSIALSGSEIIAGGGTGSILALRKDTFAVQRMVEVEGAVTSISLSPDRGSLYAGTSQGNIFHASVSDLKPELITSAHYDKVNDIVYPWDYSELFATCSQGDIRVWNARTATELVRIFVPTATCTCIQFARDGKSILSGWDDGKIRAFTPQTGKLLYTIHDAHQQAVSVLALTPDTDRIMSAGKDGQVRVWRIGRQSQTLDVSTKEHKGHVTALAVHPAQPARASLASSTSGAPVRGGAWQLVSASVDGTCVVWDTARMVGLRRLFSETMFRDAAFHPDGSQVVTGGTDKKVAYWDYAEGTLVRELETSGTIVHTVASSPDGEFLVTGGADMTLRVYRYDEGDVAAEGHGHSGSITRARVSPDGSTVVSVGEEGAVYIWRMPAGPK